MILTSKKKTLMLLTLGKIITPVVISFDEISLPHDYFFNNHYTFNSTFLTSILMVKQPNTQPPPVTPCFTPLISHSCSFCSSSTTDVVVPRCHFSSCGSVRQLSVRCQSASLTGVISACWGQSQRSAHPSAV